MKLSAIEQARADLLYDNIKDFRNWPQSVNEMLRDWRRGFSPGRGREKEIEKCLNHLGETGRIKFVPMSSGPNRAAEIGFVLNDQKDGSE